MKQIAFALLALLATDQARAECRITPQHRLIDNPEWFGVYFNNLKVGHGLMVANHVEDQATGGAWFASVLDLEISLENNSLEIFAERRFDSEPPHLLIFGEEQSNDQVTSYERSEDGRLIVISNEIVREMEVGAYDLCNELLIALYDALEAGSPIGTRLVDQSFDVASMTMSEDVYEISDVSERRILGVENLFHEIDFDSSLDDQSYSGRMIFRNGVLANFFIGPFELRAESEDIAKQPNESIDLFSEFEKELNRPLTDFLTIERLVLKATIERGDIKALLQDGYLQDVDYVDDRTALITIGDFSLSADGGDLDRFLAATPNYPHDHPRLQGILKEVTADVAGDQSQGAIVDRLITYVHDYIEIIPSETYEADSVFEILDDRIGDCTEYSKLLITLARGAGIPAREATGYVYGGDDEAPTLGGHAWVEVYLDGQWIGVDPTWNERRLNKTHVQLMKDTIYYPTLSFEVLEIAHGKG